MKNKNISERIEKLKEKSAAEKANIWKVIALELEKPTRKRRIVNLFKIDKNSSENDLVVVPGKVLATGDVTHKITVAAYSFSDTAIEKIKKLKGEAISIDKLAQMDTKGQKIKILG
jgi:large subunit ribosomal protein L18e